MKILKELTNKLNMLGKDSVVPSSPKNTILLPMSVPILHLQPIKYRKMDWQFVLPSRFSLYTSASIASL